MKQIIPGSCSECYGRSECVKGTDTWIHIGQLCERFSFARFIPDGNVMTVSYGERTIPADDGGARGKLNLWIVERVIRWIGESPKGEPRDHQLDVEDTFTRLVAWDEAGADLIEQVTTKAIAMNPGWWVVLDTAQPEFMNFESYLRKENTWPSA